MILRNSKYAELCEAYNPNFLLLMVFALQYDLNSALLNWISVLNLGIFIVNPSPVPQNRTVILRTATFSSLGL